MARYRLRLMFEWGGGCLWCGNDPALERFDIGPVEDRLGLSRKTLDRLEELSAWHDRSLNWSDPKASSPWSMEEFNSFDVAARDILAHLRSELGAEFDLIYERV